MNLPRTPRICAVCMVGGARPDGTLAMGRQCDLRAAVRAETGQDIACAICGASPGQHVVLMSQPDDTWRCMRHVPPEDDYEVEE